MARRSRARARKTRCERRNSGANAWRGANGFSSRSFVGNFDARVRVVVDDDARESRRRTRAATKILTRARRFALARVLTGGCRARAKNGAIARW